MDARATMRNYGLISDIGFGIGAAALGAGIVLFVTAPKGATASDHKASIRVAPVASPRAAGASISGAF